MILLCTPQNPPERRRTGILIQMHRICASDLIQYRLLKTLKRYMMRPQDRRSDITSVCKHRKQQMFGSDEAVSERLGLFLCMRNDLARLFGVCILLQVRSLRFHLYQYMQRRKELPRTALSHISARSIS